MVYGIPNGVQAVTVIANRVWIAFIGLILVASPASARPGSADPACAIPAYWVPDGEALLEHQTFHQVTLVRDGSVRFNGRPISDRRLEATLRVLGRGPLRRRNQIGLVVADGTHCTRVAAVRTMMEAALNCQIGMCRNGSLRQPPPPPSAHNSSASTEQRTVE